VDLDPGCVLYGNIVQIPLDAMVETVPPAVWNIGVVLILNLLFVAFFYKELRVCAFDPNLATTLGINASVMHYTLMVMVAVTTVANFEAVGSILVIAMLIVPGAAAHLLSDRMGVMILISAAIAVVSAIVGHCLATFGPYWFGLDATANTAAMIAVTAGALFLGAVLFAPQHGVVARLYHRSALALQIARQDVLGLLYRNREWRGERGGLLGPADVLTAIGDSWLTRIALRSLIRRGTVLRQPGTKDGSGLLLSEMGYREAGQLIGSHRLWEAYLSKHFQLADDHLHAPAERMEHFITPELQDELRSQLTDPAIDPHGKPIPQPDKVRDE
jgi:manganese/zinc/iron transport system permease protein